MALPLAELYRQHADECERLAAETLVGAARETVLYVAARWRALADAVENQVLPMEVGDVIPKLQN